MIKGHSKNNQQFHTSVSRQHSASSTPTSAATIGSKLAAPCPLNSATMGLSSGMDGQKGVRNTMNAKCRSNGTASLKADILSRLPHCFIMPIGRSPIGEKQNQINPDTSMTVANTSDKT